MNCFIYDITGYDVENRETFVLALNTNELIAIAEDTFKIFDENINDFTEHVGREILVNGTNLYKVLNTYEELMDVLKQRAEEVTNE